MRYMHNNRTEIQDIIKNNYIIQTIVKYFSKTIWVYLFFQIDPGLEIAVFKFHDFSRFFMTNPECDDRVRVGCGYLNQTKI